MPELPDVEVYRAALEPRILERTLLNVRIGSPFLVRSAQPPIADTFGHRVQAIRRVGKRLAIGIDNGLWLVLHLMIAGRLHWKLRSPNLSNRRQLAVFDFESGSLLLTEAGTQRRASLHIVRNLADVDPGGIEVFDASPAEFARRLAEENHTLKRALTDPRVFSGIGNAYSDEILHRARLSPIAMTQKLTGEEITRLHDAARETLKDWTERLLAEYGEAFPEGVTAFRPGMAVHGRYGEPCPTCGGKVARIRYASNETNYCPACQTGGRLLADRSLSRLLKGDWPRTADELEMRFSASRSVLEDTRGTEKT